MILCLLVNFYHPDVLKLDEIASKPVPDGFDPSEFDMVRLRNGLQLQSLWTIPTAAVS